MDSFRTSGIPAGEGSGTFDGKPLKFLFSNLSQSVGFIRISGSERIGGSGFAFDNFNATGAKTETVPEPASALALLGFSSLGLASGLKRKKLQKATVKA